MQPELDLLRRRAARPWANVTGFCDAIWWAMTQAAV